MLKVRVSNIDFEILAMSFAPLPPHAPAAPGDEAVIWENVRSSTFPTEDQAREFSLLMQKRLQQERIIVTIRTDSYFLTDGRFPIVYRFDENGTPPSKEQYEHSKTMYCFCERPGIQCSY